MNLFFDALCLPRPAADADSYALALNSISPSAFRCELVYLALHVPMFSPTAQFSFDDKTTYSRKC